MVEGTGTAVAGTSLALLGEWTSSEEAEVLAAGLSSADDS